MILAIINNKRGTETTTSAVNLAGQVIRNARAA
jgi:cellulose biosynthesis protein BcsQ